MSTQKSEIIESNFTLGPNDVVLGRGNHIHNIGNERFRSLVRSRSLEYWSCNDNVTKDNIARQIVDSVTSQQGRFVRKVFTNMTAGNSGNVFADVSVPSERWEIADAETILVKIKQTFRDFTASNKKRTGVPNNQACSSVHPPLTSILERLQSYGTLTSPPTTTPHATDSRFLPISPQTTSQDDAYETSFRKTRASQLGHLVTNVQQQQQQHENNSRDTQLHSLFEQQRAILLAQLQESTPVRSQPTQQSRGHPSANDQNSQHQNHLMLQPTQRSFHQESFGIQSTAQQVQQQLWNQQLFQVRQNQLSQGQYVPQQLIQYQPQHMQQQSRMMSPFDNTHLYPPQHPLANQSIQQNQMLCVNPTSNTVVSRLPTSYNDASIPFVQPAQPYDMTPYNYDVDVPNQIAVARGIDFPISETVNITNASSDSSGSDLNSVSRHVHLPQFRDIMIAPYNPLPITTTENSNEHQQHDSLDDEEEKKPPAP